MNNQDCIFCKIASEEITATFEHKGKNVLAFADIAPKAPIHILIVPKKHIEHFAALTPEDENVWQEIIKTAHDLIARHDLVNKGYRMVTNGGPAALVPHLHLHLLGGIEAHKEV